jgi:endonuclease III
MWLKNSRIKNLERCNELLISKYGLPFHGNKINPLDEVIYIILSSQTDEDKYQFVFNLLKKKYPSWKNITASDEIRLRQLIRPAGLSNAKAKYIIELLKKLDSDLGKRSLSFLKNLPDDEAEKYLISLSGIGVKSARCVLMYSLGRQVFPVDTHNFRVLNRLGAIDLPQPIRRWHNKIQDIIPEHLRFSLHVTLVSHGREICKAGRPLCELCPLNQICCYGMKRLKNRDLKHL